MPGSRGRRKKPTNPDASVSRTPRDELSADEIDGLAELHAEEIQRAAQRDPHPHPGSKRQRRTERTLDSVLKRLRHLDDEIRELRETRRKPEPEPKPAPDPVEDEDGLRVEAVILPDELEESPDDRPAPLFATPESAAGAPLGGEPAPSPKGALLVIAAIVILGAVTGLLILGT